jgi:MFS family permease
MLRLRSFRRVFLAQSVSVIGDGITPIALTFAVLELTGSGTDLGLVLAAQTLPLAGLALVGGVWADRLPRARVMIGSDLVRAAVQGIAAVLLLSGAAQIWQLALLAAAHGAAEAFFRPAAGALLPQIVPGPQLQKANALMGMSDNFGWMVGPAVAGTLVALIGAGGAIAVDAATFLVSAVFLTGVRAPALVRSRATQRFVAELRDGWHEVRSRTWLWVMLLRVCLVLCLVIAPFQVLGPLGLTEQGYSAAAWGWIAAVFSLGMFLGAGVAMRYRPKRPMITVTLTGATALVSPLTLALGGGPWALGAVQGVRGVAVGVLVAVWNTALQKEVEGEALGRVVAWDWMASLALWPAGLALAGPLAESLGVTTTSWISFGLGSIAAFWVLGVRDVWRMRTRESPRPLV